jgi:hypothetical protein
MAENPLSDAREDEFVTKINGKARLEKFKIDSTLNQELKGYVIFGQKTRKPFAPDSANDLRQLIEEMERVQAYRDRITEILIQSRILVDELEILGNSGTSYLYTQYAREMKQCGNKETRDSSVHWVLEPIMRRIGQWRSLAVVAELAKTNLNETYFALREIGENGRKILDARNVKKQF